MPEKLIALLNGRRGHFAMESGYHAETWYDLEDLFQRPARLQPFVAELAKRLSKHRIDAVCGPMVGGAKLAEEIAAQLRIESFVAERHELPGASRLFPISYSVSKAQRPRVTGKRVAIVDDAISAGSAVRGTLADLRSCGAEPVVLGALFVFGAAAAALAAKERLELESVATMDFALWLPEECPLCRAGVPCEKVSDAAPPQRT